MTSTNLTATPTRRFCEALVGLAISPLPDGAEKAAQRSLFNVLGTSVGAARTPALDAVVAAAAEERAWGAVSVPGRPEGLQAHWGALAVGTAAHLDDFDDTHLRTVIHPGAAILAVLFALEPELDVAGERYLTAFALGCESQLRIGNAISPSHYDQGWHITGTCGVFGATVAAGVLFGMDAPTLEHALGIASTMVLGHREAFGSMTKPLHPGAAAANGIRAARLALAGAVGPTDALGDGGVLASFSDGIDHDELFVDGFELESNAFKPYPCGIVAHPAIDAAVAAAGDLGERTAITDVELRCHPLVPELMGRQQPNDGLQSRFSAYHAVAVGLLDGEVGLPQFSDERAVQADVRQLRDLIRLVPDAECPRDAAEITVHIAGAAPVNVVIDHARGSRDRPLSDQELFTKVQRLVEPVLGPAAVAAIHAAVHSLNTSKGLTDVLASVQPANQDQEEVS